MLMLMWEILTTSECTKGKQMLILGESLLINYCNILVGKLYNLGILSWFHCNSSMLISIE